MSGFLKKFSYAQIWLIVTGSSLAVALGGVVVMEHLLHGRVRLDYLLSGLVPLLLVSLLITGSLILVLARLRRSERQLEALNARLEFLLTHSPAVMYACRAAGDFGATFISANVAGLLGYPAQAFLDAPGFWLENLHPDDRPRVLDGLQQALDGRSYQHEYRFLHCDGHYRWMHDECRLVFDAQGEPLEMVGFWIDISERRQQEEELQAFREHLEHMVEVRTRELEESQMQLNLALEASELGVWDWDIAANTGSYSDKWKAILGYRPHELSNSAEEWSSRLHPEDAAAVNAQVARAWRGEVDDYDIDFRMLHRDGEYRWIHSRGKVMARNAAGEPLRMLGTHEDITEQKRVRDAMVATLESIGDGFFACDAQWHLVYINARAEQLLGMRREQVLGRPLWSLFSPAPDPALETAFRLAAGGQPQELEFYHAPLGRWFHHRCYPRSGGGMSVYLLDITERKRQQAEIDLSRKMLEARSRDLELARQELDSALKKEQEANFLQRQFVGVVSHEFRTPLAIVDAVLDNLELVPPEDIEDLKQRLGQIRKANSRLIQLTDTCLADARLGVGLQPSQVQPLDSCELLESAAQLLEPDLGGRWLLTRRVDAAARKIRTDPGLLRIVLSNVLENARKYSSYQPVEYSLEADGQCWRLRIRDHGAGIPEEERESVFERFSRGKNVGNIKGSGLGLFVSREIMRALGGELALLESGPEGSVFELQLPLQPQSLKGTSA